MSGTEWVIYSTIAYWRLSSFDSIFDEPRKIGGNKKKGSSGVKSFERIDNNGN